MEVQLAPGPFPFPCHEDKTILATCNRDIEALLPKLSRHDYFTRPGLHQLAAQEQAEPGYCSRVTDFVIGREGYGSVMFFGETDVRWLDLCDIVTFGVREVIVYDNEQTKPPIGQGLNKPAEVTLSNVGYTGKCDREAVHGEMELGSFEENLKHKIEEQGASYISYDKLLKECKFTVKHFSRFGLDDSDDEEHLAEVSAKAIVSVNEDALVEGRDAIEMEDIETKDTVWQPERYGVSSEETEAEGSPMGSPMQDVRVGTPQTALAHSLPLHLRLDPLKMQQMKMLFFSSGEEDEDIVMSKEVDWLPFQGSNRHMTPSTADNIAPNKSPLRQKDYQRSSESPAKSTFSKHLMKVSPHASWKHSPNLSLTPYSGRLSMDAEQEGSPAKHTRILLSIEGKNEQSALKRARIGFKNEHSTDSCMFGRSDNIVDAALFLGSSFRVGWGPFGMLAHPGNLVGTEGNTVSSMIHLEKVALDGSVRDEEGKVRDELVDLQFVSPLNVHSSMSRIVDGMDEQPSKVQLRYLVCDRIELPGACNKFEDLLVKQHAVEGLAASQRLILRHQVMSWHLLSVLFSDKRVEQDADELKTPGEVKVYAPKMESELTALVRRAQFSSWLQDSVRHLIQDEIDGLESGDQLKELFALLTGRQLDDAVQLAAVRGDVRLACLISQAGGSMEMRKDIADQLEIWEAEGLDFSLIEKDRLQLYKLLSGDIQGALGDCEVDWKRFLGLLMWYYLAPDTKLPDIINAYSLLVEKGAAPQPVPMYVEEGALHGIAIETDRGLHDTAYYLMLLHANQGQNVVNVCRMFSSSSSTYDPLDHRMAWLQQGFLQSIGVLKPVQLYVLHMNFVSQLLSVGQCHWAVYVVLHMPDSLEYPDLHEKAIKEILNQYCEVWSTSELQQTFLEEELGIPVEWLHEALGTYWLYHNDLLKAVKHLIKSMQWHKAHSLFMISVAASLFLSGQHEDLLDIVTSMEKNKMELESWDVSGGIYADFFVLKNAFRSDDFTEELGSFENKTIACKDFFQRLKESESLWEDRWASENRLAYFRMADELAALLLAESKTKMLHDVTAELKLHYTVLEAPVPDDVRFCRLQEAATSFTSWLLETASS